MPAPPAESLPAAASAAQRPTRQRVRHLWAPCSAAGRGGTVAPSGHSWYGLSKAV